MYAQLEEVRDRIEKLEDDLKNIRSFRMAFGKFDLDMPTGIKKSLDKRVSKNEKELNELYIKYDKLKREMVNYIESH